jgi:hypothetical protein
MDFKFFKGFPRNVHKEMCRLQIGSTFIFCGYYCTVTRMWSNWFEFTVQETNEKRYMNYQNYLRTPSAAGRQLNRR